MKKQISAKNYTLQLNVDKVAVPQIINGRREGFFGSGYVKLSLQHRGAHTLIQSGRNCMYSDDFAELIFSELEKFCEGDLEEFIKTKCKGIKIISKVRKYQMKPL